MAEGCQPCEFVALVAISDGLRYFTPASAMHGPNARAPLRLVGQTILAAAKAKRTNDTREARRVALFCSQPGQLVAPGDALSDVGMTYVGMLLIDRCPCPATNRPWPNPSYEKRRVGTNFFTKPLLSGNDVRHRLFRLLD